MSRPTATPVAIALVFNRRTVIGLGAFGAAIAREAALTLAAPHLFTVRFDNGAVLTGASEGAPWEECVATRDPQVAAALGVLS